MQMKSTANGFSLPELLTVLLILSVISTYSIPKILAGQQTQRKKLVLKETVAAVQGILNQGFSGGQFPRSNASAYFLDRLNAVKQCRVQASTEGCWDTAIQGHWAHWSLPWARGAILHNGARVMGFDDFGVNDSILLGIDWNGLDGPNLVGDDILLVAMCVGADNNNTSYCESASLEPGGPNPGSLPDGGKKGVVGPLINNGDPVMGSAANTALFQSLF